MFQLQKCGAAIKSVLHMKLLCMMQVLDRAVMRVAGTEVTDDEGKDCESLLHLSVMRTPRKPATTMISYKIIFLIKASSWAVINLHTQQALLVTDGGTQSYYSCDPYK